MFQITFKMIQCHFNITDCRVDDLQPLQKQQVVAATGEDSSAASTGVNLQGSLKKLMCKTCGKAHIAPSKVESQQTESINTIQEEQCQPSQQQHESLNYSPLIDIGKAVILIEPATVTVENGNLSGFGDRQSYSSAGSQAYDRSFAHHIAESSTQSILTQIRSHLIEMPFLVEGKSHRTPLSQAVLKLRNHRGNLVPLSRSSLKSSSKRTPLSIEIWDLKSLKPNTGENDDSYTNLSPDALVMKHQTLQSVSGDFRRRLEVLESALSTIGQDSKPHLEVSSIHSL